MHRKDVLTETAPVQEAEFLTRVSPYRDTDGDKVPPTRIGNAMNICTHYIGEHVRRWHCDRRNTGASNFFLIDANRIYSQKRTHAPCHTFILRTREKEFNGKYLQQSITCTHSFTHLLARSLTPVGTHAVTHRHHWQDCSELLKHVMRWNARATALSSGGTFAIFSARHALMPLIPCKYYTTYENSWQIFCLAICRAATEDVSEWEHCYVWSVLLKK